MRPFSARKHHYIAFVIFSAKKSDDPSAIPGVIVFQSTRLKTLLDQGKSNPVNVQTLARELGATTPWQQLITEAA